MASFPDDVRIPSAIETHSKFDLGHQSITTTDFLQFQPAWIHEMVPGSKIKVNMETLVRANAMPVPTFSRASFRHRAYFVPFRTIYRGFNDFITDSIHVSSDGTKSGSIPTTVPTVSNETLMNLFIKNPTTNITGNGYCYKLTGTINAFDFSVYNSQTSQIDFYNFTVKGRQAIKIIELLGYKIQWNEDCTAEYSALPLLALAKIYVDWYYPQQYVEAATYQQLMALCNYDVASGPLTMTTVFLKSIFDTIMYVNFDSDWLVSAFDTPNSPISQAHSDFKLLNIDSVSKIYGSSNYTPGQEGYVTNNQASATTSNRLGGADAPFITPYISPASGSTAIATPISQYLLHALHALTDYMKRHQLAGSKAFERYLAQYGKALPAEKLNRSVYLGCETQKLQIGDVYATGSNDETELGDYAGKAISFGNGNYEFETDEFGYFIIITSLVPNSDYFQGVDRQVMRTHKLDFFNGEFDNNGIEAISAAEVFVPQRYVQNEYQNDDLNEQTFGFLPRYYGYKKVNSNLTGNFRLTSINGTDPSMLYSDYNFSAADAWHTMRTFDLNTYGQVGDIVHDIKFVTGANDYAQWKRLFYEVPTPGSVTEDPTYPADNFILIQNFDVIEFAPMKPLWDTYDFDYSNGKKVTMEINGVKHN